LDARSLSPVLGDSWKSGVKRMARLRTFLLIFGGIFFLMSALPLVRYFIQPTDIWWTPRALALALVDTSDQVEVYVRDVQLTEHIKAGRLQLLSDAGARLVTESDIRLRLNNWDRIRAQRIPSLLSAGIALGASGVFFLFGVLGWDPSKAIERSQ
jgi:hypothetical protein